MKIVKLGAPGRETDQPLADDRHADFGGVPLPLVQRLFDMKFAVAVFLGALLIFGLPGIPALHGVAGVLIGTAVMVAEVKWPKAKPIYVEPVARPKPTTPATAYVLAVIVAAASVLLVVVAWKLVLPTASTTGSLGIYLGGLGAGMAIGMVLTARQASEAHNRWLASMHPSSQLDF